MTKLTREQAIEKVGLEAVKKAEAVNAEPTNGRLGDDWEFAVSVNAIAADGFPVILTAVYYQPQAALEVIGEDGDMGALDWEVNHYTVA